VWCVLEAAGNSSWFDLVVRPGDAPDVGSCAKGMLLGRA